MQMYVYLLYVLFGFVYPNHWICLCILVVSILFICTMYIYFRVIRSFIYPFYSRRASKKEDWNAIVRKNTIARDPIGSTRNSLTRRDRRSLRRRILEVADEGLQMNTQRIVGRWFVCICLFCFLVRFRFRARMNM